MDERREGFENGWRIFKNHPLFGVGPGSTALELSIEDPTLSSPPIPPHFVPLLILDEIGIVGVIGLFFVARSLLRGVRRFWLAPVATFLVLCLFDHYPWDLWSGLALAACVTAVTFLSRDESEEVRST